MLHSQISRADILFEGYSKVLLSHVHVGYVIQRVEFDAKKKEFISSYYLKTSPSGGNVTESLKARSSSSFLPLSYQYTSLVGDRAKTIDAQFKGDMMTAIIVDNGKKQTVQRKIPKGSFLGTFLVYVMLQGKEGIKKNAKYSYQAIAEEDATLASGEAFVKEEENVNGITAFKILNTFKDSQFVMYCTYKGEVVGTRSPVQNISTELVGSVREATAGLTLNSHALTQLFGSVPRGADNPIGRRGVETSVAPTTAPAPTATGMSNAEKQKKLQGPPPSTDNPKTEGVPGGQGVMIKGSPGEQ
jgi:hypothetical protein